MVTTALLNKHHILTQVAGHNLTALKLSPPLIVGEPEIDAFVAALTDVAKDCHRFPRRALGIRFRSRQARPGVIPGYLT